MSGRRRAPLLLLAAAALAVLVLVPLAGAQAARPMCTILDFEFTETDATVSHAWNLQCSNPTGATESATFHSADATATSPVDYVAFGGTLAVPPGLSSRPIGIDVVGDDVPEPTDTFAVQFEDPEGVVQFRDRFDTGDTSLSRITIEDDDGFTVTSVTASAPEGDMGPGQVEVEVTLNAPVDRELAVDLYTQDITATAGSDYEATNVTLRFAAGEVSKLSPITILGDEADENDETFFLGLGIEGSANLVSGHVTILDDDTGGGAGPCITVSDSAVSVSGAVPSTPTERRVFGGDPHPSVTNCGDEDVGLHARGTDASGSGVTWELTDASSGGPIDSVCELGPDLFRADVSLPASNGGGVGISLSHQDRALLDPEDGGLSEFVLPTAASHELVIEVEMPCETSHGLDQPKSMDVVLTAVAP